MTAADIAVTGLNSFQLQMKVLANNLTNTQTFGFKSSSIATSDVFYQNLQKAGILASEGAEPRPIGTQVGTGTKVVGTYRNLIQGDIKNTGRALDVAITSSGYFAVQLPNDRIGYTRAGSFKISPNGSLITSDGKLVLGGAIDFGEGIAEEEVDISANGTVTVKGNSTREDKEVGQLKIYNFPNENGLEAVGDNILVVTSGSGEAIEIDTSGGKFEQRSLECSNVSAIEELTKLIALQRAYEYCSKVLKAQDSMNDTLTKF